MSDISDLTGMLVEILSKAEELADLLHLKMADESSAEMFDEAFGNEPPSPPSRSAIPAVTAISAKRPRRKHRFKGPPRSAIPTAVALVVTRRAGGSSVVQIDQRGKFTLSKALTELLLILADRAGESDDALVPWKSLDEIGRRLGVKQGKTVRRRTVTQTIHRLRKKLDEHVPGDCGLVLTSVESGARFALRK